MGSVYLLGDWGKEGVYKIGVTRGDIEKRIKKLQTGNGGEIYLIYNFETEYPFVLEKMLHTRYANQRLEGEWFQLSLDDVGAFASTCNDLNMAIKVMKEENPFFKKKLGDA